MTQVDALRRRRGFMPAAVSCLVALAMFGPTPSSTMAEHGGRAIGSSQTCDRPVTPPRCVSVADNRWHYVYVDPSVPDDLAASVRQAMADVYDPTALVLIEQSRVTALTDVIVYAADHGENGAAGWVYCPPDAPRGINTQGHRWCRHQELHFNLNPQYAVFFADDASRDHLACHEMGHTLGLRHWGNPPQSEGPAAATCMNADTPNGPLALHDYDRDHIAAYYRPPAIGRQLCLSET